MTKQLDKTIAAAREADAARQAAYKSGDKAEIAATHARCANTQANLLAALDAARGEAIGEVTDERRDFGGYTAVIRWDGGNHPGIGTKLFAAPPAVLPPTRRTAMVDESEVRPLAQRLAAITVDGDLLPKDWLRVAREALRWRDETRPVQVSPTVTVPGGPDRCPFTGLQFFMNIEHPELGVVATYGGPFDSCTIPQRDENNPTYYRYRFDHDAGYWIDGVENIGMVLVDDNLYTSEEDPAELRAEIDRLRQASPPAAVPTGWREIVATTLSDKGVYRYGLTKGVIDRIADDLAPHMGITVNKGNNTNDNA